MSDQLESRLSGQLSHDDRVELQAVLDDLAGDAARILGDDLFGVYLTGSFALGFGDLASDVDFLVVSKRALTAEDESSIRSAHAEYPSRSEHFAQHLEGSWVAQTDLGRLPGSTAPWLYVDNGSSEMEHSRHDDSWTSRWVLRRAIKVSGADLTSTIGSIPGGALQSEARADARTRADWLAGHPEQYLDWWAQPYIALTFSRLLYSSVTDEVTGKDEAVRWVIEQFPESGFNDLLQRSVRDRREPFDRAGGRADPVSSGAMPGFVAWALTQATKPRR